MSIRSLILLFLFLASCGELSERKIAYSIHEIAGRDNGNLVRSKVYRAKVPLSWICKVVTHQESLSNTMKPLAEFAICEESAGEEIRITIHNFPTNTLEERIPPHSQAMRWKSQFESLDPANVSFTPISYSGFSGIFFEAEGVILQKPQKVLAWAMQLAPIHYSLLDVKRQLTKKADVAHSLMQMQADYTIKVVGNPVMVEKYKNEILFFAGSFELISDLSEEHH